MSQFRVGNSASRLSNCFQIIWFLKEITITVSIENMVRIDCNELFHSDQMFIIFFFFLIFCLFFRQRNRTNDFKDNDLQLFRAWASCDIKYIYILPPTKLDIISISSNIAINREN